MSIRFMIFETLLVIAWLVTAKLHVGTHGAGSALSLLAVLAIVWGSYGVHRYKHRKGPK